MISSSSKTLQMLKQFLMPSKLNVSESGSQPKHTLSNRINFTRISIWKYASTQIFPVLSLNKWNHSEIGCNTLNNICEWNNVSKIKHLTYKSHEKRLIKKEQVVSWKDAKKNLYHTFYSVISISGLHNLQDQIRTLLGRNVG